MPEGNFFIGIRETLGSQFLGTESKMIQLPIQYCHLCVTPEELLTLSVWTLGWRRNENFKQAYIL